MCFVPIIRIVCIIMYSDRHCFMYMYNNSIKLLLHMCNNVSHIIFLELFSKHEQRLHYHSPD